MRKGRTCLIIKDEKKGNKTSNFMLITWLAMIWNDLTGILGEQVDEHMKREKLLPNERNGCRRRNRGTIDQLIID